MKSPSFSSFARRITAFRKWNPLPAAAAFTLAGCALAPALQAQSSTWTLAGTGIWSDIANWNGGLGPVADGASNTATFTSGGTTVTHLDTARTIGNLTFGTSGTYTIDNNGVPANILTLDGGTPTISVAGSTRVIINATISGTSGLTKANTGASSSVLELSGSNTYSGTTTVSGASVGFLQINSNAALGASSLFVSSQNGGIRYGTAFNDLRAVTFGSAGGRIDTNGFDVTISSSFSGSIGAGNAVIKLGAGTLTLAGANTISGPGGFNVSGGAVSIDSDARLGAGAGPLTLNGGAIIYGAAFNDLRAITLGTSDGTIDTNGFNVTYSEALTGGANQDLKKAGLGTLTLDGNQAYGGTTIVNAGTLLIDGSHSSAGVTVNTMAAFGAAGLATLNGALTLNNGSTLLFDGADLIDVNGALTLNNNWTLSLGAGLADGGSVTLFTYDSLAPGWDTTPTFDLTNLGFTPSGPLSLTDTGSSIVLNGVQVVPEPTSAALLFGGSALLLGLRRRRQRNS